MLATCLKNRRFSDELQLKLEDAVIRNSEHSKFKRDQISLPPDEPHHSPERILHKIKPQERLSKGICEGLRRSTSILEESMKAEKCSQYVEKD